MPRRYVLIPSGVDPLQYPLDQKKRDIRRWLYIGFGALVIFSLWFAWRGAANAKAPESTPTAAPTETTTPTPTATATSTPTETPPPSPTYTSAPVGIYIMPTTGPTATLPKLPTWTSTAAAPLSTARPGGPGGNLVQPTQTPWIKIVNTGGGVTQVPIPVVQTRVVEYIIPVTVIVPVTVVVTATPSPTHTPQPTATPTPTPAPTMNQNENNHRVYLPLVVVSDGGLPGEDAYPAP